MRIINFISTFKHYDNEESGLKPYTIRKLTDRLKRLSEGATHVKIQRAYTKRHFIRKITHVLDWDGNRIFAWNPNNNI